MQPTDGWFTWRIPGAGSGIQLAVTYGRAPVSGERRRGRRRGGEAEQPAASAGIKALDPEAYEVGLQDLPGLEHERRARTAGAFFGAIRDGNIVALDAMTGRHLWHFQTGAALAASPMSYSVNGRQFVAIAAGTQVYAFALPEVAR